MAINFPNSPTAGSTYTYQGITYTWIDTSGGGGADGYWKVNTPGSVGIATGAEVDTGTDNAKYVTPLAMEDSSYIKESYYDSRQAIFTIEGASDWNVTRWPDGRMELEARVELSINSGASSEALYGYPRAFVENPIMLANRMNNHGSSNGYLFVTNGGTSESTTTGIRVRSVRDGSSTTTNVANVALRVVGFWKTYDAGAIWP
tara:strand:- start:13192 stop:13800 length:609 start_codon:yes stop_codon:yes gene_type:complete